MCSWNCSYSGSQHHCQAHVFISKKCGISGHPGIFSGLLSSENVLQQSETGPNSLNCQFSWSCLNFIFLGLCLWCTPGAFTFSFKNCASFFQSQKFHTKPCEIKDFKNRLWLVAIMNTERHRSPEGSHSLLQNWNSQFLSYHTPSHTTNFNPTHTHVHTHTHT